MKRKSYGILGTLILPFLLVLPSIASAEGGGVSKDFCSAFVEVESTLSSSIPLAFLPPESARTIADQQLNVIRPLFSILQKKSPKEIDEIVDVYTSATLQSLETLDFSATQSDEYAQADDLIDAKLLEDCGYQEMSVTATNYEYLNISDIVPSGPIALTLVNESDEVHEILIARINDDIDLSAREILMLGEEDALLAITLHGYAVTLPKGR